MRRGALHLRLRRDVGLHDDRAATQLRDQVRRHVCPFGIDVRDEYVGAVAREPLGDAATDAAARPRDERHFSQQIALSTHALPPVSARSTSPVAGVTCMWLSVLSVCRIRHDSSRRE